MKNAISCVLSLLMSICLLSPGQVCAAADLYFAAVSAEADSGRDVQEVTAEPAPETQQSTENTAISISAPSAILMEASTGTVILDKNSREQLRPASITKIMTLILIFDALEAEKIHLEDVVTISEYAASMGGSQVFLEPFEQQTVQTLIKCISVASANDGCVAMAEYIAGSEQEFVNQMNERAAGLGMKDTHFVNCCGLDVDGHMTTAYDVALMSRELITKYPQIHEYSTIWMENITHTTKKGTSEFGLTNTNKLIKQYEYATGLKTGSTSLAKYCVAATAMKDNIELIAVVMAAPDYKVRFQDATALLNYGYGKCQIYEDKNQEALPNVNLSHGVQDQAACAYAGKFRYLDVNGADISGITKEIKMKEEAKAPIKKGSSAGKAVYLLNGKEIGSVEIKYLESVAQAAYKDYLIKTFKQFLL